MSEENAQILDFIHRRFPNNCRWTDGNCLWFTWILQQRFSFLEIYYLPIIGHFIVGRDNIYYDWTGRYVPDEQPLLFSKILEKDPIWYQRLIRDCWN